MLSLFSSTVGTLAFCVLLRAKKERFGAIVIGSVISCSLLLLGGYLGLDIFLRTLIPAAFVTLFSELCAKAFRAPVTVFLTGSIIPLLPGSLLYSAMYHLLSHENSLALRYLGETAKSALGLAIGMMAMTLLLRYIGFYKSHFSKLR